jgi:hypothetical protein
VVVLQQIRHVAMNRRIRFGLVFLGPSPTSDGQFLRDLGIKNIEGCSVKSKHYVLFTLDKAKKSNDIIRAVEEQNRVNNGGDNASDLEIELLMASDGVLSDGASTMVLLPVDERIVHMGDESAPSVSGDSVKGSRHSKKNSTLVAVFDKGHAFQSHEIFRMINMAKLSHLHMQPPPVVGEFNIPASENQPSGYWSWTSPASSGAAPDPSVRKRAISELTSNLVEGSIKPSAQKRMSPAPKDAGSDIESEVFGSNDGGGSRQQTMVDNVSEAEGAPTAPMNEGDVSAEDQVIVVVGVFASLHA